MPRIEQLLQDPHLAPCYALVYRPQGQTSRSRIAANCVQTFASAEQALQAARPDEHWYPALLYGPSRSSEGCLLYYLGQWLKLPS